MKKILILGLIVCSFLVVPMASVVGADQELLVEDDAGDVIDLYTGNFVTRKNIDIAEVSCTREGKRVELRLKLVDDGIIQNSELIAYEISLITSENGYTADYGYGECIVSDMEYNKISGADCLGVGTRTLTFIFDLLSSDEECQSLQALTYEAVESSSPYDYEEYMDMAPDEEFLTVDVGGPYEGYVGETMEFSGSVDGGTPPYAWSWDFGDGNTNNEQNPEHIYEETGEYEVTLTVTDDLGSTDSDTATATVSGDGTEDNTDDTNSDSGQGEGDSSEHQLFLFIALVAIICIVGAIVLIWIIRR